MQKISDVCVCVCVSRPGKGKSDNFKKELQCRNHNTIDKLPDNDPW